MTGMTRGSIGASLALALAMGGGVVFTQSSSLDGTAWTLASLAGRKAVTGLPTLRIERGMVGGNDGCNTFRAPYSSDGTAFAVSGPIVTTQKACRQAVMAQARVLQSALTRARATRVDEGRLTLLDDSGAELATFTAQPQDVTSTSWSITGYNNGKQAVVSVLAGTTLTLDFGTEGRVTGSAGCNRFTGAYTAADTTVAISGAAATRRMCVQPAGIMEQEAAYLKALEMGTHVRIDGSRLEIRTADGALTVSAQRR